MTSILTNNGAMVALQTLKGINSNLNDVQSQISTGLKVSTAKDNSSSWAIASTMKSDMMALDKLAEGLNSAQAMVGVAASATEQTADIIRQVQEKITQGQNPDADTVKIQAEIDALADTITSLAQSAQYNGINLVSATATNQTITVGITRDAAGVVTSQTMDVTAVDLEAVATALKAATFDAAGLDAIDSELDTVNTAAAGFGASQARLSAQSNFLTKQSDSLKSGVGALVDADMEAASARLQALQVQQQLGTQALSIANQAPQSVLSLFR